MLDIGDFIFRNIEEREPEGIETEVGNWKGVTNRAGGHRKQCHQGLKWRISLEREFLLGEKEVRIWKFLFFMKY